MDKTSHKSELIVRKGSFLWEVKGGNAKLFLKGTVHMVPKNFFPLKDEIMHRFDECRNLVLEAIVEVNTPNSIKITKDIVNNKDYIYEDGDSLYNHFPRMAFKTYMVKAFPLALWHYN